MAFAIHGHDDEWIPARRCASSGMTGDFSIRRILNRLLLMMRFSVIPQTHGTLPCSLFADGEKPLAHCLAS
jgi:hypothetical protein